MEARIAELEATSVSFDHGSLVVPTPYTDGAACERFRWSLPQAAR